jgi:peptidoglycan glycosyltransferase
MNMSRRTKKRFKPVLWKLAGGTLLGLVAVVYFLHRSSPHSRILHRLAVGGQILAPRLEKSDLVRAFGKARITSENLRLPYYPIEANGKSYHAHLTIERELQEKIEALYDRYDPAYAAFVAIDPDTGRVLAMADHSQDQISENLVLRATYPAASVFKVITSAAALGQGKIEANTVIPVNGSYGTLYKRNLKDQPNRWTRFISIEEAFAKSVNTAFGKIALNRLGPEILQAYANGFGFNRAIPFDFDLDPATAVVPNDDWFGLAEAGSGYTRRQTLSPILGALIPAAIINGGRMPTPYVVDEVTTPRGAVVYSAEPEIFSEPLKADAAKALSIIMENTVTRGTARREFRDYNHNPILSKVFIGAKTGSLSGTNPQGRYDWFVGFAQSSENPHRKIAFASLIINRQYWRIKSAHVAREAILEYFSGHTNADL